MNSRAGNIFSKINPITLFNFIDVAVFLPERRRHIDRVKALSEKSFNMFGTVAPFYYRGQIIGNFEHVRQKPKVIAPELAPEAQVILDLFNKYKRDKEYVRQCCSFPIEGVTTDQELRDNVGEIVVKHTDLKGAGERINPPYYLFKNKTKLNNWRKAEDIIALYLANSLII